MTRSKTLFYFCLSFIFGIFFDSIISISQLLTLGFLILALVLIFWKRKKLIVVGFCLIFLVLGIWRHQLAEFKIENSQLKEYNDLEEEIVFSGRVVEEPDVRATNTKLTVEVENIEERVLVTTNRYPEYRYRDELKITGELKTPVVFEDFNYRDYLAKSGIYSVVYYPEIELLTIKSRDPVSTFYGTILNFKDKLRESIYQNLSPPQSSVLGAMILGDKRRMSDDLKEKLNIAGIRHITAVSGLHVVILSGLLMSFLIGLGLWRSQAFYFSIILISLFIIMTGFQPSGIRAGIMGGLFLLERDTNRHNVRV